MDNFKENLEKAKELLEKNCGLEAMVLFGSYSNNSQNSESDVDIAFKAERPLTKVQVFNLKNELEDIFKKDVDLIDLNADIADGFKYEILINGTVLFCKDKFKFDMYKLDVFREYLELNYSRRDIIAKIKEGEDVYGK